MNSLESMKLKTFELWQEFHKLNDCYIDESKFLAEVQTYGDIEQTETWQDAWVSLKAKFLAACCPDDGQYFIEFHLLYASNRWNWRSLLPLVLAQLECYPEAVEEIVNGLRAIGRYGCEYGATDQDIEQFKEMLINGNPEKWIRRFEPIVIGA
jgi:hypothetical protein